VKDAARDVGRRVRTLLNPMVICRPTDKEAWELADRIVAHGDQRSPQGFSSLNSDAHAWKGRDPQDPYRFVGGNIRVIGSPESVVDQFLKLKAAGVDGLQLSFFDFRDDLEFFGSEVLPLMKQAGLRH
jgi:FMNH2-dependent dimethyl sulfone monooxygenase